MATIGYRPQEEIISKIDQMCKDRMWSRNKVVSFIVGQHFKGEVIETPKSVTVINPPKQEKPIAPVDKDQDVIDWVIGRYHLTLPHGTKLSEKGAVRDSVVKRIKAMIKTEEFKTGESWQAYFDLITQSDWLMGRSGDWKASLTWLLGPKNIIKVLGGEYTSHSATGPTTKSEILDAKNKESCLTFVERKRAKLLLEEST